MVGYRNQQARSRAAYVASGGGGLPLPSLDQQRIATLAKVQRAMIAAQTNNIQDVAPLGLVPTVSMAATLPQAVPWVGNEGKFEVLGGCALPAALAGYGFIIDTDDTPLTSSTLYSFVTPNRALWQHNGVWNLKLTNGRYLEVAMRETPNPYLRLIVNGVLANAGRVPYTVSAGTGMNIVKFDLGAVGTYEIGIEVTNVLRFYGVYVEAGATVSLPTRPETVIGVFIGDSYTSGVALNTSTRGDNLAAQTGKYLGFKNTITSGLVGSGYVASGGASGRPTIPAYYSSFVKPTLLAGLDPDVIVINSGYNDSGGSTATTDAAILMWQQVRADYPRALIVIGGIWGANNGAKNGTLPSRENALKAKFDAWADPFSVFIRSFLPTGSTGTASWMYGTGNAGAPKLDGINDYIVNPDDNHLTDGYAKLDGQWFVASKYRDAVIQTTNALPATYNPTATQVPKWPLTAKVAGGSVPAATVGSPYLLAVMSTGGNNQRTYSATGLPSGLVIGSVTGAITGTPAVGSAGSYNVVITIGDGSTTTTLPVTIVVS